MPRGNHGDARPGRGAAAGARPAPGSRDRPARPGPTQVVVRQYASGICHSQLHQMHAPRRRPVLLGHESTGIVEKKGSEISHVDEGDTVLVTWVPRDAANSRGGPARAALDLGGGQAVSQNVFTWADHTIADEQFVVKAPGDIATDVTSIIGCAVMNGCRARFSTRPMSGEAIRWRSSASAASACRRWLARGCAAPIPIIAVDLDDTKLEFAKRFGATHGINAGKVDAVEAIHAMTGKPDQVSMTGTTGDRRRLRLRLHRA